MRLAIASQTITALLVLTPIASATGTHALLARRHMHHHTTKSNLVKRGQCQFPNGKGLVAVTPNEQNAGWAMSPDQPCKPGMYCPYACPPGQLMAQWDPKAKSYSYPESMNGGLYCNEDGEIEKPFPNKPYCYDGTGTYRVKNLTGKTVAICQTVLPGNEAMLIPTVVASTGILAVPDTSYWCKTAAHYYINPPGVSVADGCIWGSKDKPHGNWTPYVAGANELDNGETFVKIGWNPIYLEPATPFRDVVPDYGIRVECEGTCGGLPCEINPAVHGVNEVSQMKGSGAGGANFCVVSVKKGSKANLVIFNKNGGGKGGSSNDEKEEEKKKEEKEDKEDEEDERNKLELISTQEKDKEVEEEESKQTSTPTPTSKQSTTKPPSTSTSPKSTKEPKITSTEKEEDEDETTSTSSMSEEENQPSITITRDGQKNILGGVLTNNNTNVPYDVRTTETPESETSEDKSGASIARVSMVFLSTFLGITVFML